MATEVGKADPHSQAESETAAAVRPSLQTAAWRRLVRTGGWALALGLLGLNAWWLWRDVRPVADLKTASRWVTDGRVAEAEWALREHLRRSPHDGEALMLLARALAQRGDTLECARTLRRVPAWYPDKGKMLFLEGQAFKSLDMRADAEDAWKALTAFDPLHPLPGDYVWKSVLELMELYAMEERWDEAHALLWKVYDHAEPSEHRKLLIMRMRTELERVMPSRAAAALRRFVEAVPGDWEARRALAHAEYASDHKPEAMRLIEQCVDERPDDPRGWREYLTMLHEQGDDAGLRSALARVPPAAADDPEVMKYRAALLEKQGDWSGAAALARRLVEKKPFNAEYLYKLATAEERLGLRDDARAHRERSRTVRAARADLAQVFQSYLDASRDPEHSDPRALAGAVARLSQLCEALGWSREAKAWTLLAPPE
jgi:tetratricopeptide (TPR) repeat protein